jgi:hypothetical protein
MKTILLYGQRRSGNHFLISIILQQFQRWVHINDVKLSYKEYITYKNTTTTLGRIDRRYTGFNGVDCVLISMEDKEIDYNELAKFSSEDDVHSIMLLRNPYNMAASIWEYSRKNLSITSKSISLWKIYANQYISDIQINLKVLYDKLVVDQNYVSECLFNLGIKNTTIDNTITQPYQKSSFKDTTLSKKTYGGLADCNFKDDSTFLELFDNENIQYIDKLWNQVLITQTPRFS